MNFYNSTNFNNWNICLALPDLFPLHSYEKHNITSIPIPIVKPYKHDSYYNIIGEKWCRFPDHMTIISKKQKNNIQDTCIKRLKTFTAYVCFQKVLRKGLKSKREMFLKKDMSRKEMMAKKLLSMQSCRNNKATRDYSSNAQGPIQNDVSLLPQSNTKKVYYVNKANETFKANCIANGTHYNNFFEFHCSFYRPEMSVKNISSLEFINEASTGESIIKEAIMHNPLSSIISSLETDSTDNKTNDTLDIRNQCDSLYLSNYNYSSEYDFNTLKNVSRGDSIDDLLESEFSFF